jgi:hypothetical protein
VDPVRSVRLDLRPRDAVRLRVAPDGRLLAADWLAGRVVAYSADGTRQWEWSLSTGHRSALRGFDLGPDGAAWISTADGDVYVLQMADGRERRRRRADRGEIDATAPAHGAIVADGLGGYYAVTDAADGAIRHYDGGQRLLRTFGTPTRASAGSSARAVAGAWIGRGPAGTIYYRAAASMSFEVFSARGELVRSFVARGVPYAPPGAGNQPGDLVTGTDILSDGRIVCEVLHREPYQAAGADAEGRKVLRTRLDPHLYVIALDGSVVLALSPPTARIGSLAAVGPDDHLYFMLPGQLLADGATTTLHEVKIPIEQPGKRF